MAAIGQDGADRMDQGIERTDVVNLDFGSNDILRERFQAIERALAA